MVAYFPPYMVAYFPPYMAVYFPAVLEVVFSIQYFKGVLLVIVLYVNRVKRW